MGQRTLAHHWADVFYSRKCSTLNADGARKSNLWSWWSMCRDPYEIRDLSSSCIDPDLDVSALSRRMMHEWRRGRREGEGERQVRGGGLRTRFPPPVSYRHWPVIALFKSKDDLYCVGNRHMQAPKRVTLLRANDRNSNTNDKEPLLCWVLNIRKWHTIRPIVAVAEISVSRLLCPFTSLNQ